MSPSLEASPTEESWICNLGTVCRGVVPPIWLGGTSPGLLDWLTLAGVRTRAEFNTQVTSQVVTVAGVGTELTAAPAHSPDERGHSGGRKHLSHVLLCSGRAAKSGGAVWGHSVRRRYDWSVNHILVGWGCEVSEEVKVKH